MEESSQDCGVVLGFVELVCIVVNRENSPKVEENRIEWVEESIKLI